MGINNGTQRDSSYEDVHESGSLENDKLKTDSDTPLIIKPEYEGKVSSKPPPRSVIPVSGNVSEQKRVSMDMSNNSSDTDFESAAESSDEATAVTSTDGVSHRQSLNSMASRIKNKIKSKISKYKDGTPTDIDSGSPQTDFQDGDQFDENLIALNYGPSESSMDTAENTLANQETSQNIQVPHIISAITPQNSQEGYVAMATNEATTQESQIEGLSGAMCEANPQTDKMESISINPSEAAPKCNVHDSHVLAAGKDNQALTTTANTDPKSSQCSCMPADPKHVRRKTVMLKPSDLGLSPPNMAPVDDALKSLGMIPGGLGVAPVSISKATKDIGKSIPSLAAGKDSIVKEIKERIKRLKDGTVYNVSKSLEDLKLLQKGMFSEDDEQTEKFADDLAKSNFVNVFRDVLNDFSKENIQGGITPEAESMECALQTMWTGTDASAKLCAAVVKDELYKDLIDYLGEPKLEPKDIADSSPSFRVIAGFLGILCNCIRCCDADDEYRDAGAVKVANKYRRAKSRRLQCKAEILLAYIMTEDENDQLNTDAENIKFIGEVLEGTLNQENHFSEKYCYTAEEILDALNRLAANDGNKNRIVKADLLKHYVKLLDINTSSETEQVLSAKGLWLLSFKEKEAVLAEPGCVKGLELLRENGGSATVRDSARGALWVLCGNSEKKKDLTKPTSSSTEKPVTTLSKAPQTTGHVMISYQWDVQPLMLQVRDRLEAEGYEVWMDVDDMSGSILEAMAHAVEKATIVVICLSEKYKKSPNCRTEAEYAYRCQKQIIPLMLQRRYRPDGWLGAIAGNKLYFDLSQEQKFQASIEGFLVELARFFGVEKEEPVKDIPEKPPSLMVAATSSTSVSDWSDTDIKKWLEDNGLSEYASKFSGMNGSVLLELKSMYDRAPEFFYKNVTDQLKFSFLDSLKLTKAIKTLK